MKNTGGETHQVIHDQNIRRGVPVESIASSTACLSIVHGGFSSLRPACFVRSLKFAVRFEVFDAASDDLA
jgi:hypothetical protein